MELTNQINDNKGTKEEVKRRRERNIELSNSLLVQEFRDAIDKGEVRKLKPQSVSK